MRKITGIFFVSLLALILKPTVAMPSNTASESPADSSREASLQQERQRMEAELKRIQQPEVKRERQMLDDMNSAMEKYYQSKDDASRQKYESLYKQALELPNPSAKVYSACATAANLLGRPREAIAILKKAIAEYPDLHAWGPIVPLKISGYYRIGSIAIQMGDANEATRAYETVLKNSQDAESATIHKIISLMFLAEIADKLQHDKQLAKRKYQGIIEEVGLIDISTLKDNEKYLWEFLRGWALYEQERLETGTAPTRQKTDLSKEEYTFPFMLAIPYTTMSHPTMPEMEKIAQDDNFSLDIIFARIVLAFEYTREANYKQQLNEKIPIAKEYLLSIAKTDSYFKPYAEAMLDMVQEQVDRISKRIPMFIQNFKNGTMQQRESAAYHLADDPEGIKILYEAQQDPNKYIRYIAAFNIAKRGCDPSIKPDFNIILEALTDKDPQIRREANSALIFSSSLEIGPKEIVAIIQLINEQNNLELMRWLNLILVSSPKDQNTLEAAVPELAKLFTNSNKAISTGIHNILRKMKVSKAGAVPVLLQSLKKEDNEMKHKIIELLGNLGADAEQAIPELMKYLKHEDVNLRRAAELALKKISPAKAEELLGKK